jgi:hypothetical protein
MELQKMRVWKYSPDDERVCALRYPPKYHSEETLCGMGIYKRISDNDSDNDEFQSEYHDAVGEPFSGGYDDIECWNCCYVIDVFIEQLTGGRKVDLQKMRDPNGEERVCAVRYAPVENFKEETLCGISYVTDKKVIEWLNDRGLNRRGDYPIPVGEEFEGRYGDITCRKCRDVIEYYQRPEASKA